MANTTPQVAPASSSPTSSSIEKLKGSIKALFPIFARTDPAEAYRERLCAYDRNMFDKFYGFKASCPEHQVFIGLTDTCKPDRFVSFATVAEAQLAVKDLMKDKYGPRPFVALDLRKTFQEQWTQKPDGSDISTLLKANPISRVTDIALVGPRPSAVKTNYTPV